MKLGNCIHFNGIQHKLCKAGVDYYDLVTPRANKSVYLPCLTGFLAETNKTPDCQCPKYQAATEEDVAKGRDVPAVFGQAAGSSGRRLQGDVLRYAWAGGAVLQVQGGNMRLVYHFPDDTSMAVGHTTHSPSLGELVELIPQSGQARMYNVVEVKIRVYVDSNNQPSLSNMLHVRLVPVEKE